ncbi:hypothetical protein [Okeania sp.]|uniref:hypothetical protein n=1 Tax=Okeania sp. TaxID=3100323 RepID=UPI002B4B0D30|nr:hypothetical protein [Okeania sp.]MEB3341339.1 hypothetical protein [Okeania sp.]
MSVYYRTETAKNVGWVCSLQGCVRQLHGAAKPSMERNPKILRLCWVSVPQPNLPLTEKVKNVG